MITVSWQPGALKGYSVQQTWNMLIRGLQYWQSVCRVRFGTLPPGTTADIRIYPFSGNMNGAFMGTYVQTRQIIFTTNVWADRDYCAMAFAHEIGHCFGLDHVNRPEALMYWRGSQVRYFDHIEGRASWQRFGKYTGKHWPYSLTFVGAKVRQAKLEWEKLRDKRNKEKDKAKRAELNKQTKAAHDKLVQINNIWLRIRREWESVGGITLDAPSPQESYLCMEHINPIKYIGEPVDMKELVSSLPEKQEVWPLSMLTEEVT